MSEENKKRGKREAGRSQSALGRQWARYQSWLAGLTRGQKIRYRILETATILSVFVIIFCLAISAWIKLPEIPTGDILTGSGTGTGGDVSWDVSALGEGDPSFDEIEDLPISSSGRKPGVYTFLVAGQDVASGGTDTILLLTYDTNAKTIYGMNIPRDTMMNVSTASKRINAIYNYNKGKDKETQVEKGMAALKKAVADVTGITPDYYVLVQWEAIGELVNAIGGVEFDVPFNMDYDDPYQDLHIHQKAGLRQLDGDDAMQVIRWRKNNTGSSGGDVARLAIQQDFLKAVAKKCLTPAIFLKVPQLAKIFTENVDTDLTVGNILALAQRAYGMNPDEGVVFRTAPIASTFMYNGASMVTLDAGGILEIVNESMNPYLRDVQRSDLKLLVKQSDGSFTVTSGALLITGKTGSSGGSSGGTTTEPSSGGTTTQPSGTTSDPNGSGGGTASPGENDPPSVVDPEPGETGEPGGNDPSGGGQEGGTPSGGDPSGGEGQGGSGEGSGGSGESQPPVDIGSVTPDPSDVLPDPNE